MSQVNDELFKANGLFAQGRDLLHMGSCSSVRAVVDQIVSLMTVPLVQGTLRYAWKVGQTGGVDNNLADQSAKNAASGSTYAAAVLPLVHACDPAAASVVSDNLKFGAAVYAPSQFTVFAVQLSWDAAQQDCHKHEAASSRPSMGPKTTRNCCSCCVHSRTPAPGLPTTGGEGHGSA